MIRNREGFTLIELLITIALVAGLSATVFVYVIPQIGKARDTRRKAELSQIARVLLLACRIPDAGAGEYDLVPFMDEIRAKYPQLLNVIPDTPRDPSKGDATQSYYKYVVNAEGTRCALYGNLENAQEPITLTTITSVTLGAGRGVFQGTSTGWNNTDKFYQVTNVTD